MEKCAQTTSLNAWSGTACNVFVDHVGAGDHWLKTPVLKQHYACIKMARKINCVCITLTFTNQSSNKRTQMMKYEIYDLSTLPQHLGSSMKGKQTYVQNQTINFSRGVHLLFMSCNCPN